MRRNGEKASRNKVAQHMQEMGLQSIHKRRRQRSLTDSRNARDNTYPNMVRGLEITEPFQVITSDITYIKTGEGFEYLCKIKDVVSGVVLGESMMEHMKAELVIQAIKNAMKRWALPEGTIFHSDRGCQYTSSAARELLKKYKLRQSFSRVGTPGDNAWSESFFANFKKEIIHWRWFPTREQAREAVFAYIEGFYNTRRVQKRLGYLSPKQWLKCWMDEHLKRTA
jgi:putative transposase